MSKSIYIFNRTLRLHDNNGIIKALKESRKVYPIFCVDPRQAHESNPYFSANALYFMYKSLLELDQYLTSLNSKLHIFQGTPHTTIKSFIIKNKITTLYINKDYTPFAKTRIEEISKMLDSLPPDSKCKIVEVDNELLFKIPDLYNKSGKTYRVFTPFLRNSHKFKVKNPKKIKADLLKKLSKTKMEKNKAWKILKSKSNKTDIIPGRKQGMKILLGLYNSQNQYSDKRNYLSYQTSHMSPYIKFGCISIREVWHVLKKINTIHSAAIQDQIIWREFYYHYYASYPEELEWDRKPKKLKIKDIIVNAPDIVIATIVQLTTTGYLHNRARMILAHYLLHDKKLYWKDCENFYAIYLTDYDPIVNAGNWLWIVKQPKFKWLKNSVQQRKWDKDKKYIKLYSKDKLPI